MNEPSKVLIPLTCERLYSRGHSAAEALIFSCTYPWEVLPQIGDFVLSYGKSLPTDRYDSPCEGVWIAKSARIHPLATILPPCVIDEDTEVRPGAFLRGKVLVGRGCVVGNATELKNCILFDGVQVPHYNYVGDSILGYRAHMGAGAITSNVKGDKSEVTVRCGEQRLPTGRKKCGAFLGDFAEIGCQCVLNPGSVIGARTNVYPLTSVRGYLPADSICKGDGHTVPKTTN